MATHTERVANMPAGRPTDYTEDLSDIFCGKIAQGESVRTICGADDMPCASTIFNWLRTIPEFLQQYDFNVSCVVVANLVAIDMQCWLQYNSDSGCSGLSIFFV